MANSSIIRKAKNKIVKEFIKDKFFKYKEGGKIQTPYDKCPIRSVPKSRKEPHHKSVEEPTKLGNSITAQRNINVITEPRTERHMPSSPELRNAL